MDDIISDFIAETTETLEDLGSGLTAWEKTPDDIQLLNQIFRFFHTIKGSAGFLQLDDIGDIAHAAEDILDNIRAGDARADAAVVGDVLAYIDDIMLKIDALKSISTGEIPPTIVPAIAPGAPHENPVSISPSGDAHSRSIRVSVSLIDDLLEKISDFSIVSNAHNALLSASAVSPKLRQSFETVMRIANDVRSVASQMRLQRMDRLFAPLPKAVRDLAVSTGKLVDLTMAGGAVELDRDMLDKLRDPIMHIVRNAIDHGIETPETRVSAGKPRIGKVHVEAFRQGNDIEISIVDDGAGLDHAAIIEQAKARGIGAANSPNMLDDRDILNLLTSPGFSTRESATTISGRGVGLDVVRSNIEHIGGQFELSSTKGQGITVNLRVPLSMSVVSCLILRSGDTLYHAPTESVRKIWLVDNPMLCVESVAGAHVLRTPDGNYPLMTLDALLSGPHHATVHKGNTLVLNDKVVIIMQALSGNSFAILVDDALEYANAVIRPISPLIARQGPYCGVSLQDNGTAILLLDIQNLASHLTAGQSDISRLSLAPMADPAINDTNTDVVTLVRDVHGETVALPFDLVRRVEKYSSEHHIELECVHWHKSGSKHLPMGQYSQHLSDACNYILILGDTEDICAYPIAQLIDAIAHGHLQPHGQSDIYKGIIVIGDDAYPVLRADHVCANLQSGRSSTARKRKKTPVAQAQVL